MFHHAFAPGKNLRPHLPDRRDTDNSKIRDDN